MPGGPKIVGPPFHQDKGALASVSDPDTKMGLYCFPEVPFNPLF